MCLVTLDLSEAPDNLIFYDCLLSALLKVVVLWIYKFDIQACKLYPTSFRWPVRYIFKGCFIKYALSNNVHLLHL